MRPTHSRTGMPAPTKLHLRASRTEVFQAAFSSLMLPLGRAWIPSQCFNKEIVDNKRAKKVQVAVAVVICEVRNKGCTIRWTQYLWIAQKYTTNQCESPNNVECEQCWWRIRAKFKASYQFTLTSSHTNSSEGTWSAVIVPRQMWPREYLLRNCLSIRTIHVK
jgi:hypothetical protein